MERKLIASRMQTPDGTILESKYTHNYVTHVDKTNNYEYMLDGGTDYQRYSEPVDAPMVDLSVYTDSPYEEIRKYYSRGGRGKDGTERVKWVPLCEMSDEWLKNAITYNYDEGHDIFCFANSMYMRELIYRQDNNITIE